MFPGHSANTQKTSATTQRELQPTHYASMIVQIAYEKMNFGNKIKVKSHQIIMDSLCFHSEELQTQLLVFGL
jgi:hypothetical protein